MAGCMVLDRDHSFDNIRFLLIFAVVFAHLLENAVPFKGSWFLYKVIYSFHMPAFIFLFGYFSRYSVKRIVYQWFIPYFVYQSLYLLFHNYILHSSMQIQYTTPYWILWYMAACIFYQLLIPFYRIHEGRGQIAALLISVIIALLAGFDNSIGYYLSLSRFLVFQPWFILGLYCRKNDVLEKISSRKKLHLAISVLSAAAVGVSLIYLYKERLSDHLLYGSFDYAAISCTVWQRAAVMFIALAWIGFLFVTIKPFLKNRILVLTAIGQNTLPIFLLHGFIVKAAPVFFPEVLHTPGRVFLMSCMILLLGNKVCKKIVEIIGLCWLTGKEAS